MEVQTCLLKRGCIRAHTKGVVQQRTLLRRILETAFDQEWPRQTKPKKKDQFMNFSQGHSGTKVQCALTLQPLLFWKKARETSKKARVFLFAEPLKSLEKKGKTHQKSKENRKTKKERKTKKGRIGGSG